MKITFYDNEVHEITECEVQTLNGHMLSMGLIQRHLSKVSMAIGRARAKSLQAIMNKERAAQAAVQGVNHGS